MTNEVEHLFLCRLCIFFGDMSTCIQILRLFSNLISFYDRVVSSLHILDTSLSPDAKFADRFSHSVCCLFTFLTMSFAARKFFILLMSHLFFLLLYVLLLLYLRRFCLSQGHVYLLIFSSKSLIVLAYTFRSMIHLELTSVYSMRNSVSSR